MPSTTISYTAGALALMLAVYAAYLGRLQDTFFNQASTPTPATLPKVHDGFRQVEYRGRLQEEVEHFENIFYAQDTSGPNRFAPPRAYSPPKGSIVDATRAGAWCPQGTGDILPFTSKVTNISENCLSLRIARPRSTEAGAKLPVVVWIHGGGHALGSASDILYEPDGLVTQAATDGRPLIWVAINYRLGFFGFATGDALIKAKHTNAGLRDQRAALDWVRDNIAVFGGDQSKVTVIGQSVGASDISLQLTSFGGSMGVPFSRAVMMSGGPGLNFNTESDLVANNTNAVAEEVRCAKKGEKQTAAMIECLRNAPIEKLTAASVAAMRAARPPFGEGFFYPTADNDFLPGRPSELMRSGKFVKGIPIIASWVTNDGAWYAPPTTSTDEEVLGTFGLWLTGLSGETKSRLLELYPVADFQHMVREGVDGPISPQYYRAAQINRDFWFTCPVLDFAWQYAKHGEVDPSQVRIYEHNATRFSSFYEMMGVPMWRVAHLSDIPYVLNNRVIADISGEQLSLSQLVSREIVSFVASDASNDLLASSWPGAFQEGSEGRNEEFPEELNLKLFGGPYGSGPVRVSRGGEKLSAEAPKAVAWEKLFERCDLINSEKVRSETGV